MAEQLQGMTRAQQPEWLMQECSGGLGWCCRPRTWVHFRV